MKQAWYYSLKVWTTAVVLGPFGVVLYFYSINDAELTGLDGYFLIAVFGMVFSIPSLLLLWLIANQLTKRNASVITSKLLLTVVGIVLTVVATFPLLSFSADAMVLSINASYMFVIVLGIWIYKLNFARQLQLLQTPGGHAS